MLYALRTWAKSGIQRTLLYGFQVPDKLDNWTLEKPLDFRARKRKKVTATCDPVAG
jgi:hypothetical protein